MMSEPETQIEIEDVLSSIRRLVSREAGAARPVAVTPRAPAPVAMTPPAPVEAECLVLGPALRIGETAEPAPTPVADLDLAGAGPDAPADVLADAPMHADEPGAETDDAAAAMTEPGPDLTPDPAPAPMAAPQDCVAADPFVLSPAAQIAPETETETAGLLILQPSEAVPGGEILPFVATLPPRPMTEAEVLLAEAEAALRETGAVLEDASSAIDAAGEPEEAATPSEPVAVAADLGAELSRLESTIAELEAAVAESGFEFEPETGHPFEAGAPEVSEAFEAEVQRAVDAPVMPEPAAEDPMTAAVAAGEDMAEAWEETAAEEGAEVIAASDGVAAAPEAPAPQQDAVASLAETADPETADPETAAQIASAPTAAEEPGVGMDWAEATLNLARRTPSRRLAVSEAEAAEQSAATMRSSYDELRDELAQDLDDPAGLYAEDLVPSYEDGLIDEAVLRDMVAQLVREELRGSLGERITQNVRKLVRREIQRALMGQDYD
ncbi:hypothetical protein [Rhodobacter capsulatus]|uniref:hypothetical protein n=1 Tax=Rhodobacter capsulatus TaxID=1061 RepID=UPI004026E31E